MTRTILVTGGMGFIGSCFIKQRLSAGDRIINLDALTYAADKRNLEEVVSNPNYSFVKGDIRNTELVSVILDRYCPDVIVNFAAETHVDRSIQSSTAFVDTNVQGTERLLHCALRWAKRTKDFLFVQISSDEVYGPLGKDAAPVKEDAVLSPTNPYAASKAAADLLVNSYYKTYGLPTIIVRCSNTYGHNQNPEKLIPLLIRKLNRNEPLPIYGDGSNLRNWVYVDDCCAAIACAIEKGRVGETYNIGCGTEKANIDVARSLCQIFDKTSPRKDGKSYDELITFVQDRPGHDKRYCLDGSKLQSETGWKPTKDFDEGLIETVLWYLETWYRLEGANLTEHTKGLADDPERIFHFRSPVG